VCYWAKIATVWHSCRTHRYMVHSTVLKDVSFVCVYVCVYVYFQWGIYTYMCVCVCVYIYIYIYITIYQCAYATWYFLLTYFKKKPCRYSSTACSVCKQEGIVWYLYVCDVVCTD
jgi:hypothetical protein